MTLSGGISTLCHSVPTPQPGEDWRRATADERKSRAEKSLGGLPLVAIRSTQDNGMVVVELLRAMSAAERGELLLNIESMLKREVDAGIKIYLPPMQDRNAPRRLRGLKVLE
jgi:hypothetical protein